MDIRYDSDSVHNYLVVDIDNDLAGNYQLKMLQNNSVDGLLPVSLRKLDDICSLYYEIDSRQSLNNRYMNKKMNYEELFSSVASVCM